MRVATLSRNAAVVGDGDDAALEVVEQTFEPLDGVQIQVVGGLVKQQHIGVAATSACASATPLLGAARTRC